MEEIRSTSFRQSYTLDPRYASALFDDISVDPDVAIRSRGRILKHDRTTTVALIEDGGARWVIKRYNTKNAWHGLRRTLRRSRASNCWTMTRLFQRAGITTPRPVAFVEQRWGPLRQKSYFISEYVQADNLLAWLLDGGHGAVEVERVKQGVVDVFRKLHAAGIVHGDMKATNLLVADHSITLLDLDAAIKPRNADEFARGYRKDRLRFLKNWRDSDELHGYFDNQLPG